MISRLITTKITNSLNHFPAVGIIGPRQCGKTTLAKKIAGIIEKDTVYLDMENKADAELMQNADFHFQRNKDKCIIIDEIQVLPELFPQIRSDIDSYRKPGRFIILGSSSPALLRRSNESLTGRISYHELSPFNLTEINTMEKHRLFGGYPDCFLFDDDSIKQEWLENYINSYVERDLPAMGLKINPLAIYKLLKMVSHNHGNLLNIESFSRSMGVSSSNIKSYLDYLENSFLIRRLQPFHLNIKKRLVKAPKIYLRDTGILHSLHGISDEKELDFHPVTGSSWEGYCIEQITQILPIKIEPYFYRTHQGSEVDLVLVKGTRPIATIEFKYGTSSLTTRGYSEALLQLQTKYNYIVIPEIIDEDHSKNVKTCDLLTFIQKYLPPVTS